MRIRLTRRLAALMDGIDMSARSVGDIVDLSRRDAELLIAEGWAVLVDCRNGSHDRRAQPEPERALDKPSTHPRHRT